MPPIRFLDRSRARVLACATMGLLLLADCGAPVDSSGPTRDPMPVSHRAPSPPKAPRPNIVLISIDTLRADHLSGYGYTRQTSPFLDRLARKGTRFDNAHSTSSWTLPAIVSMLTGLDPVSHGVNRGYVDKTGKITQDALSDDHLMLAEILRNHGYRTFGVTANSHLGADLGFAQGFDAYTCVGFEDAGVIQQRMLKIQERIKQSASYFLWIHYFDPHAPFRAYAPAIDDFLADEEPIDRPLLARIQHLARRDQFSTLDLRSDKKAIRYTEALYDSEIVRVDRSIEKLFDTLAIAPDDLVIITSDHGEEFLDHDDIWHGQSLFEELTHVPLIVRFPGDIAAGRVIRDPVSLLDIVPTIIDLLDLDDVPGLQGTSLLSFVSARQSAATPLHASLRKVRRLDSITVDGWKYIRDRDDPAHSELFNLRTDRAELHDLAALHPHKARVLARALAELMQTRSTPRSLSRTVTLSDERVEQLRSLGYVR